MPGHTPRHPSSVLAQLGCHPSSPLAVLSLIDSPACSCACALSCRWRELRHEYAVVDPAHGPVEALAWTADGQILTASTRSGHVYALLGRMPGLVDGAYQGTHAHTFTQWLRL